MSGLGDELRRIADELPEALETAEKASLLEGLDLAHQFSAGTLTPSDLSRLDHPYARRHGQPLLDPNVVNRQSGTFFSSWEIDGPTMQGSALVSSLFNTDPKAAEWLEPGTSLMHPRHPQDHVAEILEPHRTARIERAIEDVLGD